MSSLPLGWPVPALSLPHTPASASFRFLFRTRLTTSIMANSAGDPNPSSRQEIFHTYLSSCGSEGAGGACENRQVRTAARELLLRQTAEDRFSLLPFYPIVDQCLQQGAPSALCQENISLLMKATELLEKLCVNLFLFPWKKEIRSLKVRRLGLQWTFPLWSTCSEEHLHYCEVFTLFNSEDQP